MRNPFRRRARGRHALGAAVTAIPSAPVAAAPVPLPVMAAAPRGRGAGPAPGPAPVPVVAATLAEAVDEAVAAPQVHPVDLDLALLHLPAHGEIAARPAAAPAAPAVQVPPAAVAPAPRAAPSGPRVELGFTDGTFRMLDPASSAAQALSDLVGELTSKDDRPDASAS